jgi:UDP-N-acetylglucosamine acyltransferase
MIHPTAIVDPQAELASDVEVGPFAVIEAGVKIASGTIIGPHVHVQGLTEIGPNNSIGTGSTIGLPPQHIEYRGAPTRLVIGSGNRIRECVSIHRAFREGEATVIGNDCFFMDGSHVAHDCRLGNGVIVANGVMLGGHVSVGDRAFISGLVAVHQFCRIGRLAMTQGLSGIGQDVPPFMIVGGFRAVIRALNVVGLQRAGVSTDVRAELKRLFRALYRSGKTIKAALEEVDRRELSPEGRELLDFYSESRRGITPHVSARRPVVED